MIKVYGEPLTSCSHCPAYEWAGENIREGDRGYRCSFGGFHGETHDSNKQIPENCPLKQIIIHVCSWKGEEEYWETSCHNKHVFIESGPNENNHDFCPYCGGKLEIR